MPLQRRTLLAMLGSAATATAGCLAGTPTDSTASDATSTSTPTPPCQLETTLPESDGGPDYPSLPTSVTGDSAADFAVAFESAFQLNRLYSGSSSVTDKAATDTERQAVDGGWLVTVRVDIGYTEPAAGESTRTVAGDLFAHAAYFVGDDRAVRAETSPTDLTDPREAAGGAIVACRDS